MKKNIPNDIKNLQVLYNPNYDITNNYKLKKIDTTFFRNIYTLTSIGCACLTGYSTYYLIQDPVDSLKLLTGLSVIFTVASAGSAINEQSKLNNLKKGRR